MPNAVVLVTPRGLCGARPRSRPRRCRPAATARRRPRTRRSSRRGVKNPNHGSLTTRTAMITSSPARKTAITRGRSRQAGCSVNIHSIHPAAAAHSAEVDEPGDRAAGALTITAQDAPASASSDVRHDGDHRQPVAAPTRPARHPACRTGSSASSASNLLPAEQSSRGQPEHHRVRGQGDQLQRVRPLSLGRVCQRLHRGAERRGVADVPQHRRAWPAIGSHSPAKNIIGKNRIVPVAWAARPVGATAATNRPMAISAAAASSAARTKPPSCRGSDHVVPEPGHRQNQRPP